VVTAPPTAAAELANFALRLEPHDLPNELKELTRLRLLDALGLVLAAWDFPPAAVVRGVVERKGGAPEARLPVAGALPASSSALVLGTLVHARDFDDTLLGSLLHLSSVVVPTVLAVGSATGASGEEALVAAAAAGEVGARLGDAVGRGFHLRGFHATGVLGPLFASTAASRLYALDGASAVSAFGLAGSMGAGLLEFLSDGSSAKRLHPGRAAEGGVLAAELAREGFGGPASILEGPRGVLESYLGERLDVERLTAGLGSRWLSLAGAFKLYPCAHVLHPYITEAMALRHDTLSPAVRLRATLPELEVSLFANAEPENEYQRRASLPFVLAAAWLDGVVDSRTFEGVPPPERLALARLVEVEVGAPTLEVELDDGHRLSAEVEPDPAGDRAAAVIEKFERNAATRLDDATVARLRDAILGLEAHPLAHVIDLTRSEGRNNGAR
jgi:2-methylcitrate dehydratase PrpD